MNFDYSTKLLTKWSSLRNLEFLYNLSNEIRKRHTAGIPKLIIIVRNVLSSYCLDALHMNEIKTCI